MLYLKWHLLTFSPFMRSHAYDSVDAASLLTVDVSLEKKDLNNALFIVHRRPLMSSLVVV